MTAQAQLNTKIVQMILGIATAARQMMISLPLNLAEYFLILLMLMIPKITSKVPGGIMEGDLEI
jgi:hypothetical protein